MNKKLIKKVFNLMLLSIEDGKPDLLVESYKTIEEAEANKYFLKKAFHFSHPEHGARLYIIEGWKED